jgi:hypothetical protein
MRLEEVLPALRAGKKIRRRGEGLGGYFVVIVNGIVVVRDPYEGYFRRVDLLSDDILTDDWEVME